MKKINPHNLHTSLNSSHFTHRSFQNHGKKIRKKSISLCESINQASHAIFLHKHHRNRPKNNPFYFQNWHQVRPQIPLQLDKVQMLNMEGKRKRHDSLIEQEEEICSQNDKQTSLKLCLISLLRVRQGKVDLNKRTFFKEGWFFKYIIYYINKVYIQLILSNHQST